MCFFCVLFFFFIFLVNPIASSHFLQNAQQQNLTSQNYSLHPNINNNNNSTNNVQAMQMTNHHQFDASSFNSSNNFNHNFDPSNQSFQYQQNYQQQQSTVTTVVAQQSFEGGSHMTQQQQQQQQQIYQSSQQTQFYGQSNMMGQTSTVTAIHQNHTQGLNNGPTSTTYQHTINDLLVQHSTSSYQQTPAPQQTLYNNQVQTNQSVRKFLILLIFLMTFFCLILVIQHCTVIGYEHKRNNSHEPATSKSQCRLLSK